MSKVTNIQPQRKPGRFNIFIDGKFSFALSDLLLLKRCLKVGQSLEEEEITSLKNDDTFQKHFDNSLKFLSFRPRSHHEIEVYLAKKGVDEEEAKKIVEKLTDLKLINDREFAAWWISQRKAFRPKSFRALKLELLQKGIAREIIDSFKEGEDEPGDVAGLLRQKWSKWSGLDPETARQKASNFLLARGYSWEVVKEAIDQLLAGDIK